jgi:hypothetical protein
VQSRRRNEAGRLRKEDVCHGIMRLRTIPLRWVGLRLDPISAEEGREHLGACEWPKG